MTNPLDYQGPNQEYKPYIDNYAPDAVDGTSSGSGYADIEFLLSELESLGNKYRGLYDLCVSKMTDYTLLIDTSNETLVKSHEMSYPDDVTPDSISFEEYIYNFSVSQSSSSQYVNKYYENKVRGIYGTNALDVAHISRITYSEVKRIEAFLEKYTKDIDQPSEFRVIEIFQDWVQNAKNLFVTLYQIFSLQSVVSIPEAELESINDVSAKKLQGLFQSKLNVINSALSDILSQLYKDWDSVSNVFYDKVLGPSLKFNLSVSNNLLDGLDQDKIPTLRTEAQMSVAAFNSQFQTALSDQIKRNQLYYEHLQSIYNNLSQRDSYINYLSQLSNKGTVIPNPFVTQLGSETKEIAQSASPLSSRVPLTYDTNVSSDHNFLTNRTDPTNHPQYVLKTGDEIDGILDIDGSLILNDRDITDLFCLNINNEPRICADAINWSELKGSETSAAVNTIVPLNLNIQSQSFDFDETIEYILNFDVSDSNLNGYEFEIIEMLDVYSRFYTDFIPPLVPPCIPSLSLLQATSYDGNFSHASYGKAVWVEGDYAYVSSWFTRFTIFNISNPSMITVESSINHASLEYGGTVWKEGNTCYVVGHGSDSIVIFDVTDVTNPTEIGVCYDGLGDGYLSSPNDIVKIGDYLFIASYHFLVWNVSVPSAPVIEGFIESSIINNCASIAYDGTYFYVASPINNAVYVVDASTTSSPSLFATYTDATIAGASEDATLLLDGTVLYVGMYSGKVRILDISDPSSITELGFANPGDIKALAKNGDYLYVAGPNGSFVYIYDVSNPATPVEIDFLQDFTDLSNASHMAISDGVLYISGYYFTAVDTGCP